MRLNSKRRMLRCCCFATICSVILVSNLFRASAQVREEPAIISDRIGNVIHPSDRSYFGLFAAITNFDSATVSRSSGSMIAITIAYTDAGRREDTTLVLHDTIVRELRKYIDSYESLFEENALSSDISWEALRGIVRPADPFIYEPFTLDLTLKGKRSMRALVLYANDSVLVVAPDSLRGSRRRLLEQAEVIIPADIIHVKDTRSFFEHFFSELDIQVGRNDTMFRNEVAPVLLRRALYYPYPAPELRRMIEARLRQPVRSSLPPSTLAELEEETTPKRFHFFAELGIDLDPKYPQYQMVNHDQSGGPRHSALQDSVYWAFGLEYSIFSRLRLAARYYTTGTGDPVPSTTVDYERFRWSSIELLGKLVLIAPKRHMTNYLTRFEVVCGVGVAYQMVTVETQLVSLIRENDYRHDEMNKSVIGSTIFLGGSYYLRDYLSLGVEGRYTAVPDLEMEEMNLYDLRNRTYRVRSHSKHVIPLSFGSVHLGLAFHL